MKIAFVASEVFPYSKTGGLADIAQFLPKALTNIGVKVSIFTPYYKSIGNMHDKLTYIGRKTIKMADYETDFNYFKLREDNLDIIFVQNQIFFERDNLYGYDDDALRFTGFSFAVLEGLLLLDYIPNLIHVNDWQSALIPYLLDTHYRWKEDYKYLHTLLTIHNLEYQGSFNREVYKYFNNDFDYTYIHFDSVNFLKTGIERATKINTVSPNYSKEILTQEFGFSLDGALNKRKNDLLGILNGIDDSVFNPKTDPFIYKYDYKTYQTGKVENKKLLYDKFNLGNDYEAPLLVYIGRFANQKGLWMIKDSIESIISQTNAKFFILGSGDNNYANYFRYLTNKYPNQTGNYIGFNEELAHLLYASSDLFLMPSEFEPCGLGQMISMKYGSLPIVRETGGLKDTVIPYNKYTGEGTGFSFRNKSSLEFKDKIYEGVTLYLKQPNVFKRLVKEAMNTNYTNELMAKNYYNLYKEILGG